MNQALSRQELYDIFSLMQKMHEEAKKADWHELNRLDMQRRAIVCHDKDDPSKVMQEILLSNGEGSSKEKVNHTVGNTNYDHVLEIEELTARELANTILQLDKLILDAVRNSKKAFLQQNQTYSGQMKAMQGYAQTSRLDNSSIGQVSARTT